MRGELRRIDQGELARWMRVYRSLGWRMFPAIGKRPIVKDWPTVATCDPVVLWRWFRTPKNIGLVCGETFDVFDVEAEHVDAFLDAIGALPPTPVARTGSGGLHVYVARTTAHRTRRLFLGTRHIGELKSVRGAVTAPPSVTTAAYEWLAPPDVVSLGEATPPMLACIEPEPRIRRFPTRLTSSEIGIRKLRALCGAVARAPVGQRNAILYWAARRGREEGIPVDYLIRALAGAAEENGLTIAEIRATLRSALR